MRYSQRQVDRLVATMKRIKERVASAIRVEAMDIIGEIEEDVDRILVDLEPADDTRPKPSVRQQEMLNYIRSFHEQNGYMPSHRQIGAELGIKINATANHLKMLRKKGYLTWVANKPRTFVILDPGQEAVTTNGT